MNLEREIAGFRESADRLRTEIGRVIVGHDEAVEESLASLFAGGHVLLEGVPGLGKTLLVRTLARCLSLSFGRIQCTPDLMPADILGTTVIHPAEDDRRELRFEAGPVFTNVLLATQNPIEMEGTDPLPEAQLDRFLLKVLLRRPAVSEIVEVLRRTTGEPGPEPETVLDADGVLAARALVRRVALPEPVAEYAARLVQATHPDAEEAPETVQRFVRYGASPRGAQSLVLAARVAALLDGRPNVAFEDVHRFARPALRHRLIRSFEGEAEGVSADDLVDAVVHATRR